MKRTDGNSVIILGVGKTELIRRNLLIICEINNYLENYSCFLVILNFFYIVYKSQILQ